MLSLASIIAIGARHLYGSIRHSHRIELAVYVESSRVETKSWYLAIGLGVEPTLASFSGGQIERGLDTKVWIQKVASTIRADSA